MSRGFARANPGRVAAAQVLVDVERGAHADEALARRAPRGPDRALSWHLALGVLRRRARLDAALRPHLERPLADLDPEVRAILRVGVFERHFARTPAHAAVDQAVELCRALEVGRARGLVNAVVRRVGDDAEAVPLTPAEARDLPAWLWERWVARLGEETADAWARGLHEMPPLVVVHRDRVRDVGLLRELEGVTLEPARAHGETVPRSWRVHGASGAIDALPGFVEGRWWVQDAASAWMTDLVPEEARTVLDACAAPGGKTLRLATAHPDRRVTAVDLKRRRLDDLRANVDRVGVRVRAGIHDWREGPCPDLRRFDAVLVDAPCTGLGTVGRRPEIRWRRGPTDPARAGENQRRILEATADHVKPGGALVYVVCSGEPEEGPAVFDAFLADHPEYSLETVRCTAPPTDGEDAFWGARAVRS